MRVVDLFAGGGGSSRGFQNAGFNLVGAVENWDAAVRCYEANFGHPAYRVDLADVGRAVELIKALNPDIVIGSPPCQEFSLAGKRIEGERAGLTVSFAEIIAGVRPKFFVMENVPQVRSSKVYASAREIFKDAEYGLTEVVLNAALFGVPQRRKRFFCIGVLGGECGALSAALEQGKSNNEMTMRNYFGTTLGFNHYYIQPRSYTCRAVYSIDVPCPTLCGVNVPRVAPCYPGHKDDAITHTTPGLRPLTTLERAAVQTFPPDYVWVGCKTDVDRMIGNAVPVKLAEAVASALLSYIDTQKSVTPPMVGGTYSVILADPPWQYSFGKTSRGSIEAHYSTMTLDNIKALPIPAANDSVLYLWATAPYLPAALEVMAAWGFTYKSCMVWDKAVLGIGYWARGQHELLLIGTRGKVKPPTPDKRVSSVYREKRTVHSKKPDYFNALLEEQHPGGRFLELFARRKYSDLWTVWGNEAPTDEAGVDGE